MNNLFNGENELLANTVNKFLNDHGQEVLKEVKPAIRFKIWNNSKTVFNPWIRQRYIFHAETS